MFHNQCLITNQAYQNCAVRYGDMEAEDSVPRSEVGVYLEGGLEIELELVMALRAATAHPS